MILPLVLLAAQATATPAATCGTSASYGDQVCLALQAERGGEYGSSAQAFERAAQSLETGSARHAQALAAAGNMWIAAGEPGKAALALDRALAGPGLRAEERGQALLDRARAAEAQNDLKTARAKANEAQATISDDPFFWYFSAALAIREEDQATARAAINRALSLAPNDPAILFEAGHVAHFAGDPEGARAYWTRAASADPDGPQGKAAREAIALLPVKAEVQSGQ